MSQHHHELSNALSAALMSIQVARVHPGVQPTAHELLDTIERQLVRVAELTGVRWSPDDE